MKTIKVLEVNNVDLPGRKFNGYDLIEEVSDKELHIKQAVIHKTSDNNKVVEMITDQNILKYYQHLMGIEYGMSLKNVFSITTPSLLKLKEYKEADIVHIHLLHNTQLSVYTLYKIAKEKKLIISIHDPWFMTGRCVHFFDCDKWKTGCQNCSKLSTLFTFKEDNCNDLWNMKKNVFDSIDADIIVATDWSKQLVKESPIMQNQKRIHYIPFGTDIKFFDSVDENKARKHFGLKNEIVLFHRAQEEFKGTKYVVEALKKLETEKQITIITCQEKNMFDDLKDKYNVIDLGFVSYEEMSLAMKACDIFLMPSLGESFGLMAIEAMACAKPVIIFDNSALPSVTKAPECGYLVKNRDSEDLMKAIKTLIEDESERKNRGNLGYKIVKKEYTIQHYNERIKKLYKKVYQQKFFPAEEVEETKDEYNISQLKFLLNYFTIRFFGTKHKEINRLLYKTKNIKYNPNYKIKYQGLHTQKMIDEYMTNVEKVLRDNPNIKISETKVRMQKIIYLIKNNPMFLINAVIRKFTWWKRG